MDLTMELVIVPSDVTFDALSNGDRDDLELIRQFQTGNREAFAALYRAHQAAVNRFATYMTGDFFEAEELTQQVFVWFIHHPNAFNPERGDLAVFLGGVARKLLQRQWRKQRRWQSLDDLLSRRHESRNLVAPAIDPVRAMDAATIRRAISLLPPVYREAIVLCDVEGKSYEEAALFLKCPIGTVRSRLYRARVILTDKFNAQKTPRRLL
jgi:RNA polymerase sigma-70 factor (ECF subfamily)